MSIAQQGMVAPMAPGMGVPVAGGPPNQQFCLRWNDFQSNMVSSFQHLRDEKSFTDVTLACDGQTTKAHKMVLSACSPYFKKLLEENPAKHPIVILKDVEFKQLKAILDFMYSGEVNVAQEELQAFLRVAERLKVKGLALVNQGGAAMRADLQMHHQMHMPPSNQGTPPASATSADAWSASTCEEEAHEDAAVFEGDLLEALEEADAVHTDAEDDDEEDEEETAGDGEPAVEEDGEAASANKDGERRASRRARVSKESSSSIGAVGINNGTVDEVALDDSRKASGDAAPVEADDELASGAIGADDPGDESSGKGSDGVNAGKLKKKKKRRSAGGPDSPTKSLSTASAGGASVLGSTSGGGAEKRYFRRNERHRRRVSPKVIDPSNARFLGRDEVDPTPVSIGGPVGDRTEESNASSAGVAPATMLPWGVGKERAPFPAAIPVDIDAKPGEFVMRTLFAEFIVVAGKKIEAVVQEPIERPLNKSLQRGEDLVLDQVLNSLGNLAEHCLPSILKSLLAWYDRQGVEDLWASPDHKQNKADPKGKSEAAEKATDVRRDALADRRDLAVEFIFCLVLVEVLKQLPFHPGHNDLLSCVEPMAFAHFKHKEGLEANPNGANMLLIADLYAEVVGVLVQSRFHSVRQRFMTELKELRAKEPGLHTTQSIQALLMGMKFFRVKMVPIEEFEASFQFLHECAQYFLEVKEKEIKNSLAGLFVEILMPVAANVKTEVNVPVLKNFVEQLYSQTLDSSTKKKQSLSLFPLVTCLLCVSQKTFFLNNWHQFLTLCLQQLKSRDTKMARVALESLYRLIWVYMIRIKCESNTATASRLQSIVNSLFPKGSKGVIPRDAPLSIFVKIIQFIAQERMDFAMREIIFELLSVGRQINKFVLTPERFSIGLRAFLVVADGLQQKEGEPPMPKNAAPLPSGSTLRVKKTFINKTLTDDTARTLGIHTYYPHVRKVFGDILRALDSQVGRPLMMTSSQNANKEPVDMMTEDRKPKIDLFRTSVAAIPRLMPEGLSRADLLDLLARLTVHMDEELRGHACQSMQTLAHDYPSWRGDVVQGYIAFLVKEVGDTTVQLVDHGLRMVIQLLATWKNAAISENSETKSDKPDKKAADRNKLLAAAGMEPGQGAKDPALVEQHIAILHLVEGFALVMLCNVRPGPRKLAVTIVREVKTLGKLLRGTPHVGDDEWVSDVLDQACSAVVEKCLPLLPASEKSAFTASGSVDMQWLAERSNTVWTAGFHETSDPAGGARSGVPPSSNSIGISDPWAQCLIGFLNKDFIHKTCRSACVHAWSISFHRLNSLFSVIDPNPINEQRASLLRSASAVKKPTTEKDISLSLWKNYAVFACRVVPPNVPPAVRCASPDLGPSSSPESWLGEKSDSSKLGSAAISHNMGIVPQSPTALYKLLTPLLRCESVGVRDAAVLALGAVNHAAIKDLMEELVSYIREALDRKQENMRRRRRRDALRLQLVRVFHLIAQIGTFGISSCVLDKDQQSLHASFVEYIDGARLYLESDNDKDVPALKDIKTHFCGFITSLISSFSLEIRQCLLSKELRRNLFRLFSSWSGKYGMQFGLGAVSHCSNQITQDKLTDFEFSALQAQCASLCCGPCFDHQDLMEDGLLYPWLNKMMSSADEKIAALGHETLVLLLEFNADIGSLLDWAVDRCYTGISQVSDYCFLAIAALFGSREYPCDHYTAIINVTLLNVGCPRAAIQDAAFHLLLILDKRFFGSSLDPPIFDDDADEGCKPALNIPRTLDELLSTSVYCRTQLYLSKQLAFLHPELTMPMFSEITHRFQTARPPVQRRLLSYLLPWLGNMELVDRHVPPANPLDDIQYNADPVRPGGTCREGMGSAEATEMVLNNLFYITAKLGDDFPEELENIWSSLCSYWPNNLRVILRYLLIVTGMAPDRLLPFSKRVVVYMGRARPTHLVDELMTELQTVEALNFLIERMETPPFFRLTSVRKGSTHSENGNNGTANCSTIGPADDVSNASGQQQLTVPSTSGADLMSTSMTSAGSSVSPSAGTVRERSTSGAHHAKKLSDETARAHDIIKGDLLAGGSVRSGASSLSSGGSVVTRADRSTVRNLLAAPHDDSQQTTEDNFTFLRRQQGDGSRKISRVSGENGEESSHPRPLPMPEYGGYFAPMSDFLPDSSQTPSAFHRSNLAVMFLSDVVLSGLPGVDWWVHLPTMLHMIFLGLDHARQLVHEHCERLLLNLLVVLGSHADYWTVARVLLDSRTDKSIVGTSGSAPLLPTHLDIIFTDPPEEFKKFLENPCAPSEDQVSNGRNALSTSGLSSSDEAKGRISPMPDQRQNATGRPTPMIVAPDSDGCLDVSISASHSPSTSAVLQTSTSSCDQPHPSLRQMTLPDLTRALIHFLAAHQGQPMWNYEDLTGRVWHIKSADQLSWLVKSITLALRSALPPPHVRLDQRWSQIALHLALSSSSRHFAGRSLQVFRALGVPVNTRMLSDILTRLVETVAEQGEDMQGYVVELMLTLEAVVDSLDNAEERLEWVAPAVAGVASASAVAKDDGGKSGASARARATSAAAAAAAGVSSVGVAAVFVGAGNHVRSTSYSVSYSSRKAAPGSPTAERHDMRLRSSTEVDAARGGRGPAALGSAATNLSRSRSAQSLRAVGAGFDAGSTQEDKLAIMAQMFCIAISLLESDYDHEFLLSLRLLEKVLEKFDLTKPDCRDRVDRLVRQMRWPSFPGVHSLLLKGLTNPSTYEQSLRMLSRMITALDLHVIDPSQAVAFPLNVVALLPYMLHHYEDANELCVKSADKIAEICAEKSAKLENLATVMTLYSRRTFSKESFQWTKCVVKYLHDAYSHLAPAMISFLVEVLDHGPSFVQGPILSILHCLLHYVDIHAQKNQVLNTDLLRPVAKFLEGGNWKEALKILRLVVTRSSTLVVPPSHQLQSQSSSWGLAPVNPPGFTLPSLHRSSYSEGAAGYKKELPGRTMEFSFDLSQTPAIPKKFAAVPSSSGPPPYSAKDPNDAGPAADRKQTRTEGSNTPKRSPSQTATDATVVPGWKRPWMSQSRTRERLVNLLGTCGQRIGLPKSPSVIFSQTSEVMEHPLSSMASSMEEVSPHDGSIGGGGGRDGGASSDGKLGEESSSDAQFTVFKDFDFLENEESGGESEDNFNWGVKRSTLDLRGGPSGSMGDPKEPTSTSEHTAGDTESRSGATVAGASGIDLEADGRDTRTITHARSRGSGASAATAADDYASSEEETGGSVSPLSAGGRLASGRDRSMRIGSTPSGGVPKSGPSSRDGGKAPPSSLPIGLGRRLRRPSQDSDSSYVHSSSEGDAGDLTPCNASPCLSTILSPHMQGEGAPPPPPLSSSSSPASAVQNAERKSGGSDRRSSTGPASGVGSEGPSSGKKPAGETSDMEEVGDTPVRHQQWVESEWRNLVTSLTMPSAARDFQAKPALIAATPLRFIQLYKSLGVGLGSLVQMACDLLASESPDPWLSPLLIQLGNLSHTLTHTHPPFLWLDAWSVSSNVPTAVLDMAKFNVLEIHEHFETFLDKREHALECLEGVRSSLKLQSLGEEPNMQGSSMLYMQDHQMDLSKAVYRLAFQLVSIWDSFAKLVGLMYPYLVPHCRSVWEDATEVRREMCSAMEAAESGGGFQDFDWAEGEGGRRGADPRASDAECSESEAEQAVMSRRQDGPIGEDSLGDLLLRKQWKKALDEFKLHRSIFSVELNHMADDMMALLHIFCKAYTIKAKGLYCLPAEIVSLQETICPLKESLMHLLTSLKQAEHNVSSSALSTSSKDSYSMQRSYC